jgi:PAS domain S-box-containing protein
LAIWIVFLLFPADARTQQPANPKRVLVLYWYNKDYPWNVNFDRSFQAAMHSARGGPFEYYPEYLESNRFPGESQSLLLRDYLRQKYADRTIDVVVANSDSSLAFLRQYRNELFPNTPIVSITTRRPSSKEVNAGPGLTGVTTLSNHRKTIDLALRLHPDTKEILVISGTLQHDKRLETAAREELQGYEGRVQFSYLTDLSPDELIAKTKTLSRQSLILYIWQQVQDEKGRILETQDILSSIARSASVPIYGMTNLYIGTGAVGGYINTADITGTKTWEIVEQIANGVRARNIPVQSAPIVPIFDWRQLRRWGILEDALPSESIIRFKEPSLWAQHTEYVLAAIILMTCQAGLIGWLLIERRGRQRAEEARLKLAAIVESSGDAIIGMSLDGKILSWNIGAELMYGYAASEMIGTEISVIVPPDRIVDAFDNLSKAIRNEYIEHYESVRVKKDGTRIDVSVSLSLIKDVKGRVIAAASIARDISERKRAEQELQQLTAHLLNLQDEERRRIARELHDVTAQNLFMLNMNLSRLQGGRVDPLEARDVLGECRKLCDQSLQEIRTLSYLLHPPMLDEAGLVGALRWYVSGYIKRSGIHIEVDVVHEIGRLPSEVETALFRIVQECLTNVRRHSGSSSADIRLKKEEDQVVLQIRDHGRGMAKTDSTESDGPVSPGVGIAGMRQRLRQLGGILEIESSNRGMLVTAKVPITNGANHDSHLISRRSQRSA